MSVTSQQILSPDLPLLATAATLRHPPQVLAPTPPPSVRAAVTMTKVRDFHLYRICQSQVYRYRPPTWLRWQQQQRSNTPPGQWHWCPHPWPEQRRVRAGLGHTQQRRAGDDFTSHYPRPDTRTFGCYLGCSCRFRCTFDYEHDQQDFIEGDDETAACHAPGASQDG